MPTNQKDHKPAHPDGVRGSGHPGREVSTGSSSEPPGGIEVETQEPISDIEYVRRVFECFNTFEGMNPENLWWRTDSEYAPVTFFVNCNDFFAWAFADAVEITKGGNITKDGDEDGGSIELLESTIKELKEKFPSGRGSKGDFKAGNLAIQWQADLLFCARARKMRPQGAFYKHLKPELHDLFNACGEERGVNFINPENQKGEYKYKKEEA